jgi:outer membrane protein assembly factor BamD
MPQLAADSRRVMEKTYPNSEYLTRGFKTTQEPWWKFW